MDPNLFHDLIVLPSLKVIDRLVAIPVTPEAAVMCMTIPGQESNWNARLQFGGPARGYSQFEKGGGVWGVLNHASTKDKIRTICAAIDIDTVDDATIYEAMAWSAFLNMAMTRLLLYTDYRALPRLGDKEGSWQYYLDNWRPGAPHPETWPGCYDIALKAMADSNDALAGIGLNLPLA